MLAVALFYVPSQVSWRGHASSNLSVVFMVNTLPRKRKKKPKPKQKHQQMDLIRQMHPIKSKCCAVTEIVPTRQRNKQNSTWQSGGTYL